MRVTAAPITPLDLLCASGSSYFGVPATPYVPGVQGVGELDDGTPVWFATLRSGSLSILGYTNNTQALELIGDPAEDGTFTMRAFDASGAFDTMHLTVRGQTFHTEGGGVRNTLNVADHGASMAVVWEQETEDKNWFRWMEISLERLD